MFYYKELTESLIIDLSLLRITLLEELSILKYKLRIAGCELIKNKQIAILRV